MNTIGRPAARTGSRLLVALALAALSTAGCATTDAVRYGDVVAVPAAYHTERPMSLGEIAAELRRGRDQRDLAEEIRERGLLAPVTDDDVDLLQRLGAGDQLIDAVEYASAATPSTGMGSAPPVYGSAPPVYVTPPPAVVHDYGWYPYVPFGSSFYYYDAPRRPPVFRGHRPPHVGRVRPPAGARDHRPSAPRPGWQSPRVSPGPSSEGRPPARPPRAVQRSVPDPAPLQNPMWHAPGNP